MRTRRIEMLLKELQFLHRQRPKQSSSFFKKKEKIARRREGVSQETGRGFANRPN